MAKTVSLETDALNCYIEMFPLEWRTSLLEHIAGATTVFTNTFYIENTQDQHMTSFEDQPRTRPKIHPEEMIYSDKRYNVNLNVSWKPVQITTRSFTCFHYLVVNDFPSILGVNGYFEYIHRGQYSRKGDLPSKCLPDFSARRFNFYYLEDDCNHRFIGPGCESNIRSYDWQRRNRTTRKKYYSSNDRDNNNRCHRYNGSSIEVR